MHARRVWHIVMVLLVSVCIVGACVAPMAVSATCMPLPSTSVCAGFFPPGASVDVWPIPTPTGPVPAFACLEDAEAALASAPIIWSGVTLRMGGTTFCTEKLAQIMCLTTFRVCGAIGVSRPFCQAAFGTPDLPNSGTCPQAVQQQLLGLMIPNFATRFNCTGSAQFKDPAAGPVVGPQVPQSNATYHLSVPMNQCQTLSPTSICRGVINYPIFLPWSFPNQAAHEAQVAHIFGVAFLLADQRDGCLQSLEKMLCSLAYPRCDTNVLFNSLSPFVPTIPHIPIPFPRLPCRNLCYPVQQQCPVLLAAQPPLAAMANCSGVGFVQRPVATCNGAFKTPGGRNFPEVTSVLATLAINGNPVPVTSSCNDFDTSQTQLNLTEVLPMCPLPLVRAHGISDENAIVGGATCAIPCPPPYFTPSEYTGIEHFFTGLVLTSFIASSILWLTWIIFPRRRRQTLPLLFNSCAWALNLAMVSQWLRR
jgi:hypothetical protein